MTKTKNAVLKWFDVSNTQVRLLLYVLIKAIVSQLMIFAFYCDMEIYDNDPLLTALTQDKGLEFMGVMMEVGRRIGMNDT